MVWKAEKSICDAFLKRNFWYSKTQRNRGHLSTLWLLMDHFGLKIRYSVHPFFLFPFFQCLLFQSHPFSAKSQFPCLKLGIRTTHPSRFTLVLSFHSFVDSLYHCTTFLFMVFRVNEFPIMTNLPIFKCNSFDSLLVSYTNIIIFSYFYTFLTKIIFIIILPMNLILYSSFPLPLHYSK